MIDDLRDSGNGDSATLQEMAGDLEKGNYLAIAESFRRRTRPDQFASFIRSELDPSDLTDSPVHRTILDIRFRGIITTNFDRVFERQSDLLSPLVYPHCLDDIAGFRQHGFFAKIHGCVRMTPSPADNLVLSEESYRLLRSNPKYQVILRSCIVMHPLLTIGFSLQDPDFLGLVADLRDILGNAMPTIYSLMKDPGSAARERWLTQGVQIISYVDHLEVMNLLKELRDLSESRHPAPRVTPTSKLAEVDVSALAERWRRARTLEESIDLLREHIVRLSDSNQREELLFGLLAVVRRSEAVRLAPHLVEIRTQTADAALGQILQECEKSDHFSGVKPSHRLLPLREWALRHWREFTEKGETNALKWLLDDAWG
jgi:hypothetical protein